MKRRAFAVLLTVALGGLASWPGGSASAAVGGCAGGEDYNGDGFADLAIGVPGEDVGSATDAGAIQVIYGGAGGLTSSGDQVFHQDSEGMNDTAEVNPFFFPIGDGFGSALASGDFDGDGFDDLAVGVPGESFDTNIEFDLAQGAIHIIYGTPSGLSSAGDQVFHRSSTDIEDYPHGFDRFGSSLAACDFDGDGRDDLAVGVPFDDIGDGFDEGTVQVLYGSAGGLDGSRDEIFHQDVLNDAAEEDDLFGFSLAAGDFNADGRGDLAVGVRSEDIEAVGIEAAGSVHTIYGSSSGLAALGNEIFHQDTPGMNETAEDGDAFGSSVAAGDFNGDGFDDLTVGAPFEDIGAISDAGAVQTIYGGPGGLSASGDQVFHQESTGINDTSEEFDDFGGQLASGDFDADGFDDVAVGVGFEDLGGLDEGAVQIVYGTGAGLSSAGDQVFHQDTPGMNDTAESGDGFARAVTSGDFDADGSDDLANGVPSETVDSDAEGAVQIVYGSGAGLSSAGDQVFHQNTDGMNDTAEETDFFGGALVLSPFLFLD